MRCGPGRRRFAGALALALATVLAPGTARTNPASAPGDDAPTAGLVVHLLGGPSPQLPAAAGELRAAALDLVAAMLQSRGVTTCARAAVEDLVERHVVRTGAAFGSAFLDELRAQAGAELLVAISLQVEGDRLAARVRAIDTADGALRGIGFAEAYAGPRDGDWRPVLTAALREAVPALAPAGDGPRLVVLPARQVGLGPDAAMSATAGLLAAILADGRWRPLDPALAAGVAIEAGCDLDRLDGRARAVLRERCGVECVVAPEIVAFDEGARREAVPGELTGGAGLRADVVDFTLNLRLLDLRTGLLGATSWTFSEGGPEQGWFGRVSSPGEPARIRATARRAWSRFHGFLKESAS